MAKKVRVFKVLNLSKGSFDTQILEKKIDNKKYERAHINSEIKEHLMNTCKQISIGLIESKALFMINQNKISFKKIHLPEVGHGRGQRSLGGDVRGLPGIVVHLRRQDRRRKMS